MEVYFTLLAKHINIDDERYNYLIHYEYEKFSNASFSIKQTFKYNFYLYSFLSSSVKKVNNISNKKEILTSKHEMYMRTHLNKFMSSTDKEDFFDVFSLSQKHYLALSRFVNIVKYKTFKNGNDVDLYLNEFGSRYCTIIQGNKKYLFTLFDLKEIINNSLSNLDHGFVDVIPIKNPYNNIPFSQANLYNMYFYFKFNYFNVPILFELYFLSNFDLATFERYNEYQIKKQHTQNQYNTLNPNQTREQINNMIEFYNKYNKKNHIEIPSDDFPNELLFSCMKNYLKLYVHFKKTTFQNDKNMYKDELLHKLLIFQRFNPKFGRRYVYRCNSTRKRINFESNHPPFNEKSRINFHSSHIEKIHYPNYVSRDVEIDSGTRNMFREEFNRLRRNVEGGDPVEYRQEQFHNFFRSVMINRENAIQNLENNENTEQVDPYIQPLQFNAFDTSNNNTIDENFFFRFDLSGNPAQTTEFVYRTPTIQFPQIDSSSNYFTFDNEFDNDLPFESDSDSLPTLIHNNEDSNSGLVIQDTDSDTDSDDDAMSF